MAPRSTTLSIFLGHPARRWAEACTSGRHLLPKIRRVDYTRSLSHLEHPLTMWRRAGSAAIIPSAAAAASTPFTRPVITPVVAAVLCMKPHGPLTAHQRSRAGVELLRARMLPLQPTKFHTD
jgi:hypothetical protein